MTSSDPGSTLPFMELPPPLRDRAHAQHALVSRAQLSEHGVTRSTLRWALRSGRWQAVLPGVVNLHPGDLTGHQRLVAAQLQAGRAGMISSLSAASWHGVTSAGDRRVHVTVPFGTNRRSSGFVTIARTRRPDPRAWERGILTISSRARAVTDAARDAPSQDQAVAILAEAVQRGLVTASALRHEIEVDAPAGNRGARRALESVEAGAWSWPESELHRLVSSSRYLPTMWLNPRLLTADGVSLPTPDGWFDDVALAVQVHSWQWHSGRDRWDTTVMTDGVLVEQGVIVVAVTPHAIQHSPDGVLARLDVVHRRAAGRPRPPVCAIPR